VSSGAAFQTARRSFPEIGTGPLTTCLPSFGRKEQKRGFSLYYLPVEIQEFMLNIRPVSLSVDGVFGREIDQHRAL
jgi:hypothetical protein